MTLSHGNFDKLANNYNKYRPDYSPKVLKSLIEIHKGSNLMVADIGAGTGIWTRMLANSNKIKDIYAVEPSISMRECGEKHEKNGNIRWVTGSAENSNLNSNSFDIVTMASSFHWVNFDKANKEFYRILKENGIFCALWNSRSLENNELLLDIENKISELNPNIKRVSSGKSKFVENLMDKFNEKSFFKDVQYIEGVHTINMSKEQYIGVWMSVNDIQYQLGKKFEVFINYINKRIQNLDTIECKYITRSWIMKKK